MEKGEQFNDAEYLREELLRSPLVHDDGDEGLLFRQMIRAWDALAFQQYSEEGKKRAVANLTRVSGGYQPFNFKPSEREVMKAIAQLDVMATAVYLPPKELDPKMIVTEAQVPPDLDIWYERFAQDMIWAMHKPMIGEGDYGGGSFS